MYRMAGCLPPSIADRSPRSGNATRVYDLLTQSTAIESADLGLLTTWHYINKLKSVDVTVDGTTHSLYEWWRSRESPLPKKVSTALGVPVAVDWYHE